MCFMVTAEEAASIREAYQTGGELSASVELRRLFPLLPNNENTTVSARTIAGWKPLPAPVRQPHKKGQRR